MTSDVRILNITLDLMAREPSDPVTTVRRRTHQRLANLANRDN
jgi:BMFP domain-containing protein YqiC